MWNIKIKSILESDLDFLLNRKKLRATTPGEELDIWKCMRWVFSLNKLASIRLY